MLRIRDVFVSHTHIDHFIGFDQLLRILVGRDRTLRLFGPAGFLDQVEHRLAGYSWNLVHRYATDLGFVVTDIASAGEAASATYRFQNRFRREGACPFPIAEGLLSDARGFRVRCPVLALGLRCLSFANEDPKPDPLWGNRVDE